MKALVPSLLVAAALAVSPADTAAQSFQPEWVPASAHWVVHVDIEGLLDTRLVRELGVLDELANDADFAEIRTQFGVSPTEDLASITLFGARADDPEAIVALVETTSRIDGAIEKLEAQTPSSSVEVDGFALKRWQGDGDTLFSYVARNRITDERLAIVSDDERDVAAALRVLRGETPSMRTSGALSVAAAPGAGALVYLAAGEVATGMAKREADLSTMAELVRSMVFEAGEDGDETYLKLILETDSEQSAAQVAQIAQGAIAFGRLAANSEPDMKPLGELLGALSLRADGSSLRAQWRQSTPRLVEFLRENADVDVRTKTSFEVERELKSKQGEPGESKTGWR